MHFLDSYLLFLGQTVTLIVGLLLLLAGILALTGRAKRGAEGHITITKCNDRFQELAHQLKAAILEKHDFKAWHKAEKKAEKAEAKARKQGDTPARKRLYIIDFDGDIRASAAACLREEITAILAVVTPEDEVVCCLESPGGMVHSYGFAASQLQRLRDNNIPLTVIVDKVAASGGYLMASVANQIIAAPFAMIGSIGVVAQIPNFHRFLKKHNVDFEQITAGEHKRTLTVFGENTDKGRKKFQEEIEDIHRLFKQQIAKYRPQVDIDSVATGEHWSAQQCLELGLVDALGTSDDYLFAHYQAADIFHVTYKEKLPLGKRLLHGARSLWETPPEIIA